VAARRDSKLGIGYDYGNGKHEAHPIRNEDWPIIERLERAGKPTYTNDRVRELAAKLREGALLPAGATYRSQSRRLMSRAAWSTW
jgi:hypothetical protein